MTSSLSSLAAASAALLLLTQGSLHAADAKKFKLIDAFNSIDPKTVQLIEIVAKPVTTPDPVHKKALELVADFAKPGSYPSLVKKLPPNFINTKKFSGVRVWYRSNSGTTSSIYLAGVPRKDGRPTGFRFMLPGKPEWQEALIDFSEFKNNESKVWDKASNAHKVFPGGESPTADDFELMDRISIITKVESRGSDVKSHFMIDGLSFIEK